MARDKKEKAEFGDFIKTQVEFVKKNEDYLKDLSSKQVSASGFESNVWNKLFSLMKETYLKLKSEGYSSVTKEVDYNNPEQKSKLTSTEVLWTNDRLRYIHNFLTDNQLEESEDFNQFKAHAIFLHLSLMVRDIQKV